MNNNLSLKIQVQGALAPWLDNFAAENNIPASVLYDALKDYVCDLKDKVFLEYLSQEKSEDKSSLEEETPQTQEEE